MVESSLLEDSDVEEAAIVVDSDRETDETFKKTKRHYFSAITKCKCFSAIESDLLFQKSFMT